MDGIWTVNFWKATLERVVKTIAQALVVILGGGVGLLDIDWGLALLGVLGMALMSLLTSIISAGIGPTGSPSLVADASTGRHAKP